MQTREYPTTTVRTTSSTVGTDEAASSEDQPRQRLYALRMLILPSVIVALIPVALLGAMYWQDQIAFISTDNAIVTGGLVQVGTPLPGQVRQITVDVGQEVSRSQIIATVVGPSGQALSVRSPKEGVVAARHATPGDTLPAGRPILTLVDPTDLWVQAHIDETQIARVRPGQRVDVTVDSLGQTLGGRVVAVGAASGASLSAQGSTANSPMRVRQVIPVKIELDHENLSLVHGGSAFVKIHVRA